MNKLVYKKMFIIPCIFISILLLLGCNAKSLSYNHNIKKYSSKNFKRDLLTFKTVVKKPKHGSNLYNGKSSLNKVFRKTQKSIKKKISRSEFYKLFIFLVDKIHSDHKNVTNEIKNTKCLSKPI
ncbi:hypothetical protein ACFIJ5_17340 [Haloimpatiens sp. FM7330]|uniref:hypothetical protein n=1 Tax=Haloimpatiens sp. FM7330 TaxID=3298610 RepID=UPI00362FB9B1